MLRTYRHHRRASWRRIFVTAACLGLAGYFAHHAVNGRHGLEARRHMLARAPQVERQLVRLEVDRARLKHEVALLSSDMPSRDLVEEIAREMLGYVLPSEIVWIGR